MDQSVLAARVGISRSSMSRIVSGVQEPKLRVAQAIASALGVSLDYLIDDAIDDGCDLRWEAITADEAAILHIVRRLGPGVALDRLLTASDNGEDR